MRKEPSFVPPSARRLLDGALGAHPDAAGGDDQLAVLVAVFGDALGEHQLAGALALALPGVPGLGGGGQHVAGATVPVIFEVLFGVQTAAASTSSAATAAWSAGDAGGVLARAEPGLAG